MDDRRIAGELIRVAKLLEAVKSPFTIMRPLQLKTEGATRASIANARLIKGAGYEIADDPVYEYDKTGVNWDLEVDFVRPSDGHRATHNFDGFSWGYSGEGPRGLIEFSDIFGLGLDKDKILGKKETGLPDKGIVPLIKGFR